MLSILLFLARAQQVWTQQPKTHFRPTPSRSWPPAPIPAQTWPTNSPIWANRKKYPTAYEEKSLKKDNKMIIIGSSVAGAVVLIVIIIIMVIILIKKKRSGEKLSPTELDDENIRAAMLET